MIAVLSLFIAAPCLARPSQLAKMFDFGSWTPPASSDDRGPCPALNTLANHGIFPRSGRNITDENIRTALTSVYRFNSQIADSLIGTIVDLKNQDGNLDLIRLREHNKIEHDASLVHQDTYFGDNWVVIPELLDDFIAFSADHMHLTVSEIGKYRRKRQDDSKDRNPEYKLNRKLEFAAFSEAATLIAVFGKDSQVSVDTVETFLGNERLPETYVPRQDEIGLTEVLGIVIRMKWAAGIFW